MKPRKQKRRNPVAKNIDKFNRPQRHKDRTKYQKKDKYKHILGEIDDV